MTNFNFLLNNLSYLSSEDLVGRPMDSTCFRSASVPPSFRLRLHPLRMVATLLLLLCLSVGEVWGAKITYTFSSKGWKASPANWTSGKDGNAFTANQGIQVTSGASGANGTSPSSFTGISKIEVQYCTNASSGKGTIKVKVGSGTEKSFSVSKPSSGGQTLKTATFNFSTVETGSVKVTGECSSNSVYIWSVTIYYQTTVTLNKNSGLSDGSAKFQHDATAYVTSSFTPVTRSGYDCTGYWTASSGGTKILNADGTRAANVSGWWVSNKWAKEDATATLYAQWEAAAMYTVTLMDDGDTRTQASAGAAVTLPSRDGCTGYTFAGWTKSWGTAQTTWTTTAPTIIPAGSYTPSADENLYPVYTKTESGDPVETKTQTFQYDTWTNGGSSTDKSAGSYRLFHDGGYVESASNVDFSKLSKVIVYGGTFGGTSYDDISIRKADGTVWKNATVSGASQTGTNEITGGASLTGSAKLRVYSTCGTASGTVSGVRISKVEVYTMEDGSTTHYISVPDCCTPLGSINGSVKVISGTSATLQWDDLSDVDGTTPYSVSVSPSEGTSVGEISTVDGRKNCTISGLTAGTEYTFTINAFGDGSHCDRSQDVVATTPKITLGSASGTSTYIEGSGPGSKQTFTVNAVGLTGNLTVTAPTNFAVCATESGSYTSSITLTPTSGAVSTTVYFQLVAGKTAASSPYAGNITVSGGSATEQTVAVNGTVSVSCEDPTITVQPAVSASYNMNVIATALSVTATKNGTGPALTYQWYSNTANSKTTPEPTLIDDATSASYTPLTTATGTKYYFCEVSSGACAVTSNISAITVNTPTITVSETARAFGDRKKDGSYTMTFTVRGNNLAKDAGISLAISGTNASLFSIDRTSLSATSNAVATTTITVTYSPNAVGSHSAQIDITSTGATTKTVALSGTGRNEYTITFNDNGSTTTEKWLDQSVHATPDISACKAKYSVLGWTTTAPTSNAWASAPSVTAAGNNITVTGNATYYAVYTEEGTTPTNNYRKITSQSELISGREYVITNTGDSYALNCTSFYYDYSFGITSVSPSAGVLTTTTAAMIFTITGNTSEGYSIFSAYDDGYGIGYGYVEAVEKDTLAAYNNPYQDWKITVNDGGNTYIQPKEALYDYFYYESSYYWLKNTATANHLYRRVFNTTYISNPDCRTLESIAVKAEPETNYCEGDWLDMSDLVITATYTDASTEDIDYASNVGDFTFSPSTSTDLTSSNTSVTITYGGKSTSQTISVGTLRSITLTGSGTVANGTISADKSSACAGETVTLTATPDTHYSLSSWTVTGATSGDNITVTNNQFTMPDENVTVNATMSEDPYRMVVFQNDGVATFDDGGDASAVDATNKWKQKVYVGEAPVWPTKLTDVTDACDATSNKFYGWATNTWSDVLDDTDALEAWDGGTVYTSGPLANVTAGTSDVVYHAVWVKADTESDVINYSATSSKLGSTSTSSWVTAWDLTGSTGAKYNIYSMGTTGQTTYGLKWNSSGYLFCKTKPTSGKKLLSVSATGATGKVIEIFGTNTTAYSAKATATDLSSLTIPGTYEFTSDYEYIGVNGTEGSTTINALTITYGSYSKFMTTCCDKNVTLATNSPSHGSITFSPSGTISTCGADAATRQTTMTVTPDAGYYLSTWSTSGVTPASLSTDIAYGSVSNSGAQATTITFNQNTTAGTYTANATFAAIPVSSLTLHATKKDNTSATIFDETGNNVALSLYPTEGKTASPADPLGHTVKIEFGAVLPANALNKGYTWSATVNGEDVGWSSNSLENNAVLEFNKNTGKVVAKAAGTAEIIITADDGSGVTAKVTITVANVALSSLNVAKSSTTLYVGESEQIAVTYDPVNTTTKGYTTGSYTYVTIGRSNDKITLTGKAVTPGEPERVTLTSSDAGAKTATIDVTVKPLPKVTFVDNLQGKTDFSNWGSDGVVSSTVTDGVVTHTKPTPSHTDISDPGASYNACERSHLHLVGWIESTWADAHPSATHEQIVGANVSNGAGTFLEAGADFNVETYNGNTYYAVWSQVE